MANKYRTHNCGELTAADEGAEIKLSGWVNTRRDHGGLIFIDLRDKHGLTQLTFDPSKNQAVFDQAEGLRGEFVVAVSGKVALRPDDMKNSKLATGEVEIEVSELEVLSEAQTPPFEITKDDDVNEELRLEYRYLDLRRKKNQEILQKRDEFIKTIREYFHGRGFTEVQTPIMANSSPEGARDYVIPSRLHPGKFYALPQAPQQYKQLLMVGGVDKYFQIAPCFRDEDVRADRATGDFYQMDLEMSFVEQEDVWDAVEPLMIELTEKFSDKEIITKPFARMTWHEAMSKYGSDKPDLRFDMEIVNVGEAVAGSEFGVFEDVLKKNGVVHALKVEGGASFTRSDIDKLTEEAKNNGAKGLAYILVKDENTSPIIKYLGEEKAKAVVKETGAKPGDAIFFGADTFEKASKALGAVRNMAADKLNLKDPSKAAWVWITDFPMYEFNEEADKIDFSHNPFSMPQGGLEAMEKEDPLEIKGYQYDLVFNGHEISSGAIRNHRPDIMYKAFEIAGYSKAEVDEKFGGMIKAFKFGAPPHGGFAPGVDRLFYLLLGLSSVRDVVAFPKDGKARDLMMNSPASLTKEQLKELSLEIELDD